MIMKAEKRYTCQKKTLKYIKSGHRTLNKKLQVKETWLRNIIYRLFICVGFIVHRWFIELWVVLV